MDSSSDSIWADPKKFFDSMGPGLPRPSAFLTPSDARQKARGFSSSIFSQWATLHTILERYESLIRRLWSKKSQEQRKKLLLRVWPDMSPMHRPDYKAMEKEGERIRTKGDEYRDAFMWPYINIEDLVKGKTMLLFLNSRGRNLPEAFANSDLDATHIGVISQAVGRPFLNCFTMFLHGRNTPGTYGEIVSWDDLDDGYEQMMSGSGYNLARDS